MGWLGRLGLVGLDWVGGWVGLVGWLGLVVWLGLVGWVGLARGLAWVGLRDSIFDTPRPLRNRRLIQKTQNP